MDSTMVFGTGLATALNHQLLTYSQFQFLLVAFAFPLHTFGICGSPKKN